MNETLFHLTFVVTFLSFTAIRIAYLRLAKKTQGKVVYREGKLLTALRLAVGLPFMAIFFAYMLRPGILVWSAIPLPAWARWTGLALSILSVPLILWVHRSLRSNFSTTLHVRDEHTLITQGPYRWVRHPMYTVLFLQLLGVVLLTANGFIGGVPFTVFLFIVATRLQKEEAAMCEKFGEQYRRYMGRTGRFLPRWKGIGI